MQRRSHRPCSPGVSASAVEDGFDVVDIGSVGVFRGTSASSSPTEPVSRRRAAGDPCGSIDDQVDRYARTDLFDGCGVPRSQQAEIPIDGQSGRVAECPNHIEATVVTGGRLYLFTLRTTRDDARAVFDAFAATIDLTPETGSELRGHDDDLRLTDLRPLLQALRPERRHTGHRALGPRQSAGCPRLFVVGRSTSWRPARRRSCSRVDQAPGRGLDRCVGRRVRHVEGGPWLRRASQHAGRDHHRWPAWQDNGVFDGPTEATVVAGGRLYLFLMVPRPAVTPERGSTPGSPPSTSPRRPPRLPRCTRSVPRLLEPRTPTPPHRRSRARSRHAEVRRPSQTFPTGSPHPSPARLLALVAAVASSRCGCSPPRIATVAVTPETASMRRPTGDAERWQRFGATRCARSSWSLPSSRCRLWYGRDIPNQHDSPTGNGQPPSHPTTPYVGQRRSGGLRLPDRGVRRHQR